MSKPYCMVRMTKISSHSPDKTGVFNDGDWVEGATPAQPLAEGERVILSSPISTNKNDLWTRFRTSKIESWNVIDNGFMIRTKNSVWELQYL